MALFPFIKYTVALNKEYFLILIIKPCRDVGADLPKKKLHFGILGLVGII